MKKYEFKFNKYMNFFIEAKSKKEAIKKFNKQFPSAKDITILRHGIVEKVKGFDKLGVNADMFKNFLFNFYNAVGLEARETIVPISVKYCKDDGSGAYLRFDYKMYDNKQWLHVKSPTKWY